MRARLVVTPGEPAGIGPDLCLLTAPGPADADLFYVADPALLQQRAQLLGKKISINLCSPDSPPRVPAGGTREPVFNVIPVPLAAAVTPGRLDASNSPYVIETLRIATQACLAGDFDGLVTGPVHKGIINDAGIAFTGHTEFLAQLCGGTTPVMMLQSDTLRVALVTTHVPLSQVSQLITAERVTRVIEILLRSLTEDFAVTQPALYVCGLNPHAGENGHLGREEIEVLIPVIEKFRCAGFNVTGPLPADTIFLDKILKRADAILAMYHDQGLPVLKATGFGQAVNITLGLPVVRVSVDHGVALDLAAQRSAIHTGSFLRAISLAALMARNRQHNKTADAYPA